VSLMRGSSRERLNKQPGWSNVAISGQLEADLTPNRSETIKALDNLL
jgi:hypothetical protein